MTLLRRLSVWALLWLTIFAPITFYLLSLYVRLTFATGFLEKIPSPTVARILDAAIVLWLGPVVALLLVWVLSRFLDLPRRVARLSLSAFIAVFVLLLILSPPTMFLPGIPGLSGIAPPLFFILLPAVIFARIDPQFWSVLFWPLFIGSILWGAAAIVVVEERFRGKKR